MLKLFSGFKGFALNDLSRLGQQTAALIHTSPALDKIWNSRNLGPRKFELHNNTVFEPQLPDEKPRPAVS